MKLLGPYKTQLNAFFYQELLDLLKDAIKAGELSGNKTFDTDTVQNLIQQAKDFSDLPTPSAGQRVTDDSLNTPLNLLQARLKSLSKEVSDFDGKADLLISVIEKDSVLLDQLLATAYLETWVDTKQKILGAERFYWDYGMGYGQATDEITSTDPVTGVTYTSRSALRTYFDTATGLIKGGLSTHQSVKKIIAKNIEWHYTSTGQVEELYGDDWAQLSLLEKAPLLSYTDSPTVNVVLPSDLRDSDVSSIFSISGQSTIGSIPIYVKTSFQPRRNTTSVTLVSDVLGGTFEAVTTWTMNGWLRFNSTSQARTGSYSAKSTNTTDLISPSFNILATQKFYVESYVKGPGADGTLQVSAKYYDSGANLISTTNFPTITPTTGYEKISQVLEAPISTASAVIVFTPVATTTGNWYVDDVRINLPKTISNYNISQEEIFGYLSDGDDINHIYFAGIDFVVNGQEITFTSIPDGQTLNMRFTEFYPAYQCSVNEKSWSQLVMMDPITTILR
jgi:hypothetical protein